MDDGRLPGADRATIEEGKITHYLLAGDHPAGRGKARFFGRFGFSVAEWQRFAAALLAHARSAQCVGTVATEFGTKHILDGRLSAPDGRTPIVRAIWFVAVGSATPRLVTAYGEQRGRR